MNVQSIFGTSSVTSVSGTASTQGSSGTGTVGDASTTRMSSLMDMLSQLQDLQQSDPEQFKAVMKSISDQLKQTADATGDQFLSDLSDKFAEAGESGDLSEVTPQPPPGPPPGPPPDAQGARAQSAYAAEMQRPALTPDDLAAIIQGALSGASSSSSSSSVGA